MAVNDRDLSALEHLAYRIREDTPGIKPWDREGTHVVFARELKGKHLLTALELVMAHAADPGAKTPGAVNRPFLPEKPAAKAPNPHPPKRGQDCPHHPGQWADRCGGCVADRNGVGYDEDQPAPIPPRTWDAASDTTRTTAIAQARAALRQTEEAS